MKRVVEVHKGVVASDSATTPRSVDQALEQRARLIHDIQGIQSQLATRNKAERPGSRTVLRKLLQELGTKQSQLRSVKQWLRSNEERRVGEWQLLSRSHALLKEVIRGVKECALRREAEEIMRDIEVAVPEKFLNGDESC